MGPKSNPTHRVKLHKDAVRESRIQIPNSGESCWRRFRIYIFGTASEVYQKPQLSKMSLFLLLLNIHLNPRFLYLYAEQAIHISSLFVAFIYCAIHILICPSLCYLYGFLGVYGERSFIQVWEMMPLFQGISVVIIMFDFFNMAQTSLMLTSGIMMLFNGHYSESAMFDDVPVKELVKQGRLTCVLHDPIFDVTNGTGTPFGASRLFNLIGNEMVGNTFLSLHRVSCVIGIWTLILAWIVFANKKLKIFLEHGMPIITLSLLSCLAAFSLYLSGSYELNLEIMRNAIFYQIVVAFAISEYLPSHWITIGYLNSQPFTRAQIWSMPLITAMVAIILSYAVVHFVQDFAHILDTELACVDSFGMHFFFVIIPYSIRYRNGNFMSMAMISAYILIITLHGISYIVTNINLLMWAFMSWKHSIYRYRNLVYIILTLGLAAFSVTGCTSTVHRDLHYVNDLALLHVVMITFIFTVLGIAIYGLRRIMEDHQFFNGTEYPCILGMKILFTVTTEMAIFYGIFMYYAISYYYTFKENYQYILEALFLLFPIPIGMMVTIVRCKAYNGIITYPLPTWGRPDEASRAIRRRRNMRQMFVSNKTRECFHNCLLNSKYLKAEIEDEIKMRKIFLGEDLNLVACDCNVSENGKKLD